MALSDEMLQDIINRLSPEERKQLLSQLGRQVKIDSITNPTGATGDKTKPKVKPKSADSKAYCCPLCGSASYKRKGHTNQGMQRYLCKDCGKSFSENYGDSLRYSHLSESQWMELLRGIVNNHSLTRIAQDSNISVSTAWACRTKVNQAIATMYGYTDLFKGTTEADEYYCRAAFKGKRDPEFFIFTLHRMPRHHYNYEEKIEWLRKAGLYDYVMSKYDNTEASEDENGQTDLDRFFEGKMKRGISNEQICILTLVDENNRLYLEPVTVGRLEKAMVKSKLKPKFTPDKSNVLVTDDHSAYDRALYGTKARHEVVPSGKHAVGKYNLAKVNSVHSALSKFMDPKAGKVYTTKYLDLNLMLFWWLFKYRDFNTEEKARALYSIMNDQIPDIELREKVNQVTLEELQSREITIDTKGQFPTRL